MERGQHPVHSKFDNTDTDAELRKAALNVKPAASEHIVDMTHEAELEADEEELTDADIVEEN